MVNLNRESREASGQESSSNLWSLLVEGEKWGRGQQLPLLHFWVSVGWAKVQYSGSKGLYWIMKGRM